MKSLPTPTHNVIMARIHPEKPGIHSNFKLIISGYGMSLHFLENSGEQDYTYNLVYCFFVQLCCCNHLMVSYINNGKSIDMPNVSVFYICS